MAQPKQILRSTRRAVVFAVVTGLVAYHFDLPLVAQFPFVLIAVGLVVARPAYRVHAGVAPSVPLDHPRRLAGPV